MTRLELELSESEARDLIRLLHQSDYQEQFPELYGRLQRYFFEIMTIEEFQRLVGDAP